MELELIFGMMKPNMKENGKKIRWMGLVFTILKMEEFVKGNGKKVILMVMENLLGSKEKNIMDFI